MKKTFSFTLLSLILMSLLALSTGCAALREQAAYNDYMNSQVENYEYTTSFTRVWSEAHRLLVNHGYRVRNSHSRNVLMTDWRANSQDSHVRYIVTGQDFGDGKCAVTFEKEIEHYATVQNNAPQHNDRPGHHPPGGYHQPKESYYPTYSRIERDYNMEIQLINKVEPANLTQIRREASAYSKANSN